MSMMDKDCIMALGRAQGQADVLSLCCLACMNLSFLYRMQFLLEETQAGNHAWPVTIANMVEMIASCAQLSRQAGEAAIGVPEQA